MATHELESQPGRQIEKRVEPNESHVHCCSKKKRTKLHTVAVFLTVNFRSTGLSYLLQHSINA